MTLKVLNVVEHPDRVAIEYSLVDGYPQTFANEPGDGRCTWDNLHLALPVKERTPEELRTDCVALAMQMLRQEVENAEAKAKGATVDWKALAEEVLK